MKFINNVFGIGAIVICAISLSGCDQKKGNWYDFGNGAVNLDQVNLITSDARLSTYIEAYDANNAGGNSDQTQAIKAARARFCKDAYKPQNVNGSIPVISKDTSIYDELTKTLTAEVLKTCWVKIEGSASIKFDQFTLQLDPFTKTLCLSASNCIDLSEYTSDKNTFSKALSKELEQINGNSSWQKTYSSIYTQVKF